MLSLLSTELYHFALFRVSRNIAKVTNCSGITVWDVTNVETDFKDPPTLLNNLVPLEINKALTDVDEMCDGFC